MTEVYILNLYRRITHEEYNILLSIVSPEKYLRVTQFRNFSDAQLTLVADALARLIFQERWNISINDSEFEINKYGKPFLRNRPNCCFNVSHSGHYVVCAIRDKSVGVDVEEIKFINLDITKRIFTDSELIYLYQHSIVERRRVFYRIWTMKEAYIKYIGKGFSMPLTSFSVLKSDTGAFWHQIFEHEEAVCYLCSGENDFPKVFYISINQLLQNIKSSYLH